MTPAARRALVIAWPSFLMACVLEMLVFALVDPERLRGCAGLALGWSPLAVYSVAFIVFWAVIAAASAMTLLLDAPPADINSRGFR